MSHLKSGASSSMDKMPRYLGSQDRVLDLPLWRLKIKITRRVYV